MKPLFSAVMILLVTSGSSCVADAADSAPHIRFATNFIDLGKITVSGAISGEFVFTNTGNASLKIDPPQSSCDCTEPVVVPNTLQSGETGKIMYTIRLDRPLNGQRHIRVHSNDPDTPSVDLVIQMDYTPLYQLEPKSMQIAVPAGKDEAHGTFTVARVDGKPLEIERLTGTPDWISAAFEPVSKPEEGVGHVQVTVRRPPGPPALIGGKVELWAKGQSKYPAQTLIVSGEAFGEIAAIPARIYWVIPDLGPNKKDYPAEALTRKIQLNSVLGNQVDITRTSANVPGLRMEVVPRGDKKRYELILKFDELPTTFINTKIKVETSLPTLPLMELPLVISVPNAGSGGAEAPKQAGNAR